MIIESAVAGLLGGALLISVLFVTVALLAATYRIVVGPTLSDRVVALDMFSMLLVVFLVLFSKVSGVNAYMYVAIGLALISFLATVAFAHFVDRAEETHHD